jgi:hypothetical protein
MRDEKITIICTECKKEADSWDLIHEETGKIFGVCLNCIKENMSPSDFKEMTKIRSVLPGVDRIPGVDRV